MAQIQEIKRRMKAVANMRRITRTMQMIATSKFARAEQQATAARPYTQGVFELVRELAATAGQIEHPLIVGPSASGGRDPRRQPALYLVLSSDRGLCGPYNSSVLRSFIQAIESLDQRPITEVVGKKGARFLRFKRVTVSRHHTHFGDKPRREDIDRLAEQYMQRFTEGEVSAVRVAYMRYISAGKQEPHILQLLPLKPPQTNDHQQSGVIYEFSPPAEQLLAELLPVTVKTTLNQCFNEAIVSEHVARMVAMKAATDNAGKMGNDLRRRYNRARQAEITTELTEIISGAAALE